MFFICWHFSCEKPVFMNEMFQILSLLVLVIIFRDIIEHFLIFTYCYSWNDFKCFLGKTAKSYISC
jgi:hypothetical protein